MTGQWQTFELMPAQRPAHAVTPGHVDYWVVAGNTRDAVAIRKLLPTIPGRG